MQDFPSLFRDKIGLSFVGRSLGDAVRKRKKISAASMVSGDRVRVIEMDRVVGREAMAS
jgi:hypothetical protein